MTGSSLERAKKNVWRSGAPLRVQAIGILLLVIGPLLVSLVMLGFVSQRDLRLDKEIAGHREGRLAQTELLAAMVDAETAVRGFLLTDDRAFLEPFRQAQEEIPRLLAENEEHQHEAEHTHDHEDQPTASSAAAEHEELEELARQQLEILGKLAAGSPDEEALLRDGKRVMDAFRGSMTLVLPDEDQAIVELRTTRSDTSETARTVLIAGGAASVIGATVGGTLLMTRIVRRLSIVTENARRVAEGEELEPVRGGDEIALLQGQLERSAQLLRARESQLRQAKEEADRANQAKSDFISRMSHELRTPLNAILGFAQILREDADETTASDVDQILRAGKHLLSLINEVLDLSRIESGQFAISLEQVAVGEVVQECVELMVPLAGGRRITISNNMRMDDGLHVLADRQRLKQVFLNLLSNAVKYNKERGSVDLSCTVYEDKVRLSVRDTGPGIPKGNAEQIFVPFARLGAETTEIEGTGLGLALSLRLMQMMEGDLNVGYSGPQGTEFWLELKMADTKAFVAQVESGAERPAPRPVPSEVTILQVEDNPTNVRLLQRIMSRRPHVQLVTVYEGSEAVDAARASRPSLILLDVNLPDISGREVLARLLAEPDTSHIPVVMLSADASPGQVEKLLGAGASAYVTKPLDIDHFLSVIDEVLERGAVA